MEIYFDNERPIYIQLVEKMKIDIVSGKYQPGDKIMSIRDLAMYYKVNPNTLQRALADLEKDGLIYTERTNGKYVTKETACIDHIKQELANDKMTKYIADMQNLGISPQESINMLQKTIKK